MIASNQPTDASQTPQLSAERVRQVHAVCLLLDTENKAVAAAMSPNERGARLAAPHGFTLAVVALAMLAVGVVATIGWWGMQPDIQRVADFRWETDYAEHAASDAVLSRNGQQLLLATRRRRESGEHLQTFGRPDARGDGGIAPRGSRRTSYDHAQQGPRRTV